MKPTIISAVPVPFGDDLSIDLAEFDGLLEHIAPCVDSVLIEGTTGEFPALDDDERIALFSRAGGVVGAERVMAHVGHASRRQSGRLIDGALQAGITRLAAISPYFLQPTPELLVEHYHELTALAPQASFYVYLFPERTGADVDVETFAQIMSIRNVTGVKLSGGSNALRAQYRSVLRPGQELYSGDDSIVPQIMAEGGHGVVSGVSSAFPASFGELAAAVASGDAEATAAAQSVVVPLVQLVGPSIPRLKHAIASRRGAVWRSRMTMDAVDAELAARIEAAVAAYG